MKFKGLKTIAAVTAVSAGVLFAGANSANASTRVTVKSGDTISELAKTYNVSMQSIKDATTSKILTKFMLVKFLISITVMFKLLHQLLLIHKQPQLLL